MKKTLLMATVALALASAAALAADAGKAAGGKAYGEKLYTARCLKCHGVAGDGTGKLAALLDPKPTNFTDAAWQAKMTDADVTEAITHGGKSKKLKIGYKMPAFGEKLKPADVQALVTKVRSFAKK